MSAAGLSACGASNDAGTHTQSGEALNLTAQTGAQRIADASFSVVALKDGSGVLTLKGRRNLSLDLKGGGQFSVMPVQVDPAVDEVQYFIATSILVDRQTRHIGWVASVDKDGWKALKLPFVSAQPIRPPVDINGDGRREFVVADSRFSTVIMDQKTVGGPETYYIIKDGKVFDQTAHAQYSERRATKRALARAACLDQQTTEACSVFAAWSAQARKLDDAWPLVLQLADQGERQMCLMDQSLVPCAAGQTGIALTPPEVIQFQLAKGGYIAPVFLNLPGEDDTSFGCSHARTMAERTICADPDLRMLERREAADASRKLALAEDRSSVFDDRMSFIARRDRTMGVLALTDLYRERLGLAEVQ